MEYYSYHTTNNIPNFPIREEDVIQAAKDAYFFARESSIISPNQISYFAATNQGAACAQELAKQFFPYIKEILYPCSTNKER